MALRRELEQFLVDLAKKPATSTGYWPGTAGSLEPAAIEQDARALENDLRVESVERKYSGKTLLQLWVILA
jgi:hypothetical protein